MPSPISTESSGLAITERNGEFFVTSETVAAGAGVQHASVLRVIDDNRGDFESFGTVGFEIRSLPGGGRPARVALLNEQQSTLLMTYQRNTEQVRAFKKALVKAFYEMARQVQPALPQDYASALRALADETEQKALLEAKVEADAPKVAHVEMLRLSDGLTAISDLAVHIKTHAASNFPGIKVKRDDVFDLAGVVGLIIRGNTVRHNQPTAKAVEAGWVKPADHTYDTNNHGQRTNYYARLTHRGAGRLWDAAIHNLSTYGAVLAPKPGVNS